jgi:hypothetical protein
MIVYTLILILVQTSFHPHGHLPDDLTVPDDAREGEN